MRESAAERARRQARESTVDVPQVRLNGLEALAAKIINNGTKTLLPTQKEFIFSPERIKLYMGPVGCAKTKSLIASFLIPCILYPGSRWLVARATWWTLEQTTLADTLECLRNLGPGIIVDRNKGPPFVIHINPAAFGGASNADPSEITFTSIDDIGKLGSLQYNGIAVDEVSEIPETIITTLNGRLRFKRPSQVNPDGPFFLNLCCNPVSKSHWIHRRFCNEKGCDPVPMGKKFKPQKRENEANLPPGYYETISKGYTPEQRVRFVDGECGADPTGKAVFSEFRGMMHVDDLKYLPGLPMIRGWDFGRRRPACVWAQLTPEGWLNRLACELGENELLDNFAARILMRSQMQFSQTVEWTDYVDPHGVQKKDTSEETSISILQKLGLQPRYRDTNVSTGIGLMSRGLSTLIKGRPRSMYDRAGCNSLIEGYSGGYIWAPETPGQMLKEEPFKDGYYEHLMDADRYIEVNLNMGSTTPLAQHKRVLRRVRNSKTGY